jgi:hypothetical protein
MDERRNLTRGVFYLQRNDCGFDRKSALILLPLNNMLKKAIPIYRLASAQRLSTLALFSTLETTTVWGG